MNPAHSLGVQQQYPERLGQLFIYEAPTVFWALWNMIWPFLTVSTRGKVQLVSGESGLKAIHSMVPPSILPASLGGTSPLKRFSDAVKSLTAVEGAQHGQIQKGQDSKANCKQAAHTSIEGCDTESTFVKTQ